MTRRTASFFLAIAAITSFACSGDVAVVAQLEGAGGGDPVPLADLEVRAIPFDRDVVFDSLTEAAASPEPQAPDSLVQLQQQIAEAQPAWTEAETRWNTARDSLRKLLEATQRLAAQGQRASAQYRLLVSDYDDQDARARAAERESQAAFRRYEDLLGRYNSAVQEFRIQRDNWDEEAFADVGAVLDARRQALGREEAYDTTSANGVATFRLPKGQWWINARYELPYEELYWNEPVEVTGGDPVQVLLNRSTASIRPRY